MAKEISLFSEHGKFLMLALDHRGSLRRLLNAENPKGVSSEQLINFKQGIIEALKDQFSGLLIDPQYGLRAYREVFGKKIWWEKEFNSGNLPDFQNDRSRPFLLSIERSGFREKDGERITELEHTVKELKNLGAAGVKLLLYFNPESQITGRQLSLARKVLADCRRCGLPLFLELITYSASTSRVQPLRGLNPIEDSIRRFLSAEIRPSVFKLEYPGSAECCQKITELLGEIPWVLLSRGKDFEVFRSELEVAIANGADGFLAGRALWQEAAVFQGSDREKFLTQTLPARFRELISTVL